MENKKLTITEKGNKKSYIRNNEQELGEVMINYFEGHHNEILEKTRETNLTKSKSKEGNQNDKKDEILQQNLTKKFYKNIRLIIIIMLISLTACLNEILTNFVILTNILTDKLFSISLCIFRQRFFIFGIYRRQKIPHVYIFDRENLQIVSILDSSRQYP